MINLLNTRNGKYAAVCALDFLNPPWNRGDVKTRGLHPPGMYDDFATRDLNGGVLGSHLYPYFSSRHSRTAIMSGHNVPVHSCWNGIGLLIYSNCLVLIADAYSCIRCHTVSAVRKSTAIS